ncbi:MAG: hypothetical protein KME52_07865 [Desmonostoc geniculatum HA4340-LM1]|nr:hypothetical protein [Desmonostoc geniculatum HA4340-LM1]
METIKVLSHFNDLGIKIWVGNDKLRYRSLQGISYLKLALIHG